MSSSLLYAWFLAQILAYYFSGILALVKEKKKKKKPISWFESLFPSHGSSTSFKQQYGNKKRKVLPRQCRQIMPLKSQITSEAHSRPPKVTLKGCLLMDWENGTGEGEISGRLLICFIQG